MPNHDPTLRTHPTGLILRREQNPAGEAEIRRRLRAGSLTRVARGYFAPRTDRPDHELYRLRAAAAGLTHADGIVTGPGAALLQGNEALYPATMVVDVLSPRVDGSQRSGFCRLHAASDGEGFIVAQGVRVTGPVATALETAMLHGARAGMVVAESMLWHGKCTRDELAAGIGRTRRRKGRGAARFVAAHAGDRSQSVGETLTRWCIGQAGLPAPLQQVDIFDADGNLVARVDFFWPEFGIIVEFDGDVKMSGRYGDPVDVARRRGERDAALMRLGMRVLHVRWDEVFRLAAVETIRRFYAQFAVPGARYLGQWRLAELRR